QRVHRYTLALCTRVGRQGRESAGLVMSCAKRYVPKLEFPRREVITLALCSTTLNYTLVNLFPYVGIMVKDMMALDSINEAGFYAGYVASAFTFGRLVSGYAIGYLSDKIGRKP
ncbi:unnamed protein product, partial [Ascophyllum nodosum]